MAGILIEPSDNFVGLNPVVLISAVQANSAQISDTFANLTCLYNRYWYPEPDRLTFPICFFKIKKFVETWTNETSKKRVILYTPTREAADPQVDSIPQVRPGVCFRRGLDSGAANGAYWRNHGRYCEDIRHNSAGRRAGSGLFNERAGKD
jgi:hypothetical protein